MTHARILFVDDHVLFRESVVRLLGRESDMEVVAQCGTLDEARQFLRRCPADIVLLDYDLGVDFGTNLFPIIAAIKPSPQIIMVTGGMQTNATLDAVRSGISGVVLKHSEPEQLVAAIREVMAGRTWWDKGVLGLLSSRSVQIDEVGATDTITDRQRQVLQHILNGLTNKEIAVETSSSVTAVKASIQELFSKTGVRTRSQLVRIAVESHASDWLKAESG